MKIRISKYRALATSDGVAFTCTLFLDDVRACDVEDTGVGGEVQFWFMYDQKGKKLVVGSPRWQATKQYRKELEERFYQNCFEHPTYKQFEAECSRDYGQRRWTCSPSRSSRSRTTDS